MANLLELFISAHGDDNDFNDSDDVMGWLSASITEDFPGTYVLTVTHEIDNGDLEDNPRIIEKYRITPFGPINSDKGS